MKVVTATAMSKLEEQAYKRGCQEEVFMEQAGRGIAQQTLEYIRQLSQVHIVLLCGKGNNAGDAYVAGFHLIKKGLKVSAIQPENPNNCSSLCQKNRQRFLDSGGTLLSSLANLQGNVVLIDGIFGTGFKGEIQEPYRTLIKEANQSRFPVLSIDIPSGLNGNTGEVSETVIQAKQTLFLGLPKLGFFLCQGLNYCGELHDVDFGLPHDIIETAAEEFNLLGDQDVTPLLPSIQRTRSKYQAGHVVALAGSPNMPGAALLSSLAALRGGCGIIHLMHPEGMQAQLSNSPYELIKVPYAHTDHIDEFMNKASAVYVGPGMGKTPETRSLIDRIVPKILKPCVIDADALTLYAEIPFNLPKQCIMTPHTGEMQKLLKSADKLVVNIETLKNCQQFAEEKKVTLILKGAVTFIFHPQTPIWASIRGNPGMATAGSGDVLTGLLAALLAQGLDCHSAACLGVYLHGLAGEYAVKRRSTMYGLMASDLIAHLKEAFSHFQK